MQNKIEAIIHPFEMETINDSLQDLGISEQTFSQVKKFDRPDDLPLIFRMKKQRNDIQPEVMIEMIVEQAMTETIIETIQRVHGTEASCGCEIFVLPVEEALWI
jgi:nitrogen regulatory protein P-II 1